MATTWTAVGESGGATYRLHPTGRLDMEGGQAVICTVAGKPDLLAKVFANAGSPAPERRLRWMSACSHLRGCRMLSWPQELLHDGRQIVGYLMHRVPGCSLGDFARSSAPVPYPDRLRIAVALAEGLQAIHDAGLVVGDLNPANVLVDLAGRRVVFIDTDSFQMAAGNGEVFLCPVFMPDFTAPELLAAGNIPQTVRTPEHDRFALAVLVFWLLAMRRPHEYTGPGTTPDDLRIAEGDWAHSRRHGAAKCIPVGGVPWEAFPPPVQDLFVACFDEGHLHPARRPSAGAVAAALREFGKGLGKASQDVWQHCDASAPLCPVLDQTRTRVVRRMSLSLSSIPLPSVSLQAFAQSAFHAFTAAILAAPGFVGRQFHWWPRFIQSYLLTTGRLAWGTTLKFLFVWLVLLAFHPGVSVAFGITLALHATWEIFRPQETTDRSHPAGMGWWVAVGGAYLVSAMFLWIGLAPV